MSDPEEPVVVLDEAEHRYARTDPSGCARLYIGVRGTTDGSVLVRALRGGAFGEATLLRAPRYFVVKLLVRPPICDGGLADIETHVQAVVVAHGATYYGMELDRRAGRYEVRDYPVDFEDEASARHAMQVLARDALGGLTLTETSDAWVVTLRENPGLSSLYVHRVVDHRAAELGGSYLGWIPST